MKGHKPGGGIASKVNVQTGVRTGSGSKGVSPGWVGQKGQMQGTHTTNRADSNYRGEAKFTGQNFQPTMFGNEKALDVRKGGPGTGRTIHSSGSQGQHGNPASGNPPAKSTDILNQFGPNIRRY